MNTSPGDRIVFTTAAAWCSVALGLIAGAVGCRGVLTLCADAVRCP